MKLLSVKNIRKTFGQNEVLKDVSFEVDTGECLCLIGGNGAGKSTLMKIISGLYKPDNGAVSINGSPIDVFKPSVSLEKGVYMIPQEPMLFPNMSVEDNIFIGLKKSPDILRKKLNIITAEMGWVCDMAAQAMTLSIAAQQLVEIIRGLLREAKLLILDEPTSALTFDEVNALFTMLADLKAKGIGIMYITHRLTEVFRIGTDVAVMRDGVITVQRPVSECTASVLIEGLLSPQRSAAHSRHLQKPAQDLQAAPASHFKPDQCTHIRNKCIFELQHYSGYGFTDISLRLFAGEILGIAGVVGAGRTELAAAVFGIEEPLSGKVLLNGVDVTGLSTTKILLHGINYVPEDRKAHAVFGISSVAANMTSALLSGNQMGRFIFDNKKEADTANRYVQDFRIKITGINQYAAELSGGNQQKIVIGRALSTEPKVLILDEPTRGIDAAARSDIYRIIVDLKTKGVGVLLISSDMEEIIELSDRAVVLFAGKIQRELSRKDINQTNLAAASFGICI